MRSFLGLCSYYRTFVQNFSKIASPLYAILMKQDKIKQTKQMLDYSFCARWNEDCDCAFMMLKKALTSTPVLGYPYFKQKFILEIDASYDGLGAVLSQDRDRGRVVIAYA